MARSSGKILVLGAPKTGTASAGDALRHLGYIVSNWSVYRLFNCLKRRDLAELRTEIDAHDTF